MNQGDRDGAALLTGAGVGQVLEAAVAHRGGRLLHWEADHVDADPGRSTTATYRTRVEWRQARDVRDELVGLLVRADGLDDHDGPAEVLVIGDHQVAVWFYPDDPELPGLARVAHPDRMAELLAAEGLLGAAESPEDLQLSVVSYRPRRRAVLRARLPGRTLFVKVLREAQCADVVARHELLRHGGVPSPEVLCVTDDHLVVLDGLPGDPLARAMFNDSPPCTAGQLVALLDNLPPGVSRLERRRPWADVLEHYAQVIGSTLPEQAPRLESLASIIRGALDGIPLGDEPTHGDFHEGQVHVAGGSIVGLLDVDTCGPGRRADDLACLVAHLSTVQRMNLHQAERVNALVSEWVPVFDERVDPIELRLRAAAVVISLATGPFRGQEDGWQRSTVAMIDTAEALVRQAQ